MFHLGSTPCHDLAGQAIGRSLGRLGSAAHDVLLPTVPPDPKDPTILGGQSGGYELAMRPQDSSLSRYPKDDRIAIADPTVAYQPAECKGR